VREPSSKAKEDVVSSSILYAADHPPATINGRLRRGEIRQLGRGIYTTDLNTGPGKVVTRSIHEIGGRLFDDAVITDRSALTGGLVDGHLYLSHPKRHREVELPGVTITARHGAGPLPSDTRLPGGLHLASKARALAENSRLSRAPRGGGQPRTLDIVELADWVSRLCQFDGAERLQRYREDAEHVAETVGTNREQVRQLSTLIGAALGTKPATTASRSLNARQAGIPYDPVRDERFDRLAVELRSAAPQTRPGLAGDPPGYTVQAFWETYFSNYIEGTTFTVDEARRIVFDGEQIGGRQADSHDVAGTYRIVSDIDEMSRTADDPREFVELLKYRHSVLMAGRPNVQPGAFKELPNQAGQTLFVDPALVDGTLIEGFHRLDQFDTAWERAVFVAFVVAEVHPFVDGNGRMARVMMNAELVHGNQSKIIVPTGFRSEYLASLHRLSRDDDPSVFIKAMRYLHDYTSEIDWTRDENAESELDATNAFNETDDPPRLTLLRGADIELDVSPVDDAPVHSGYVAPYIRNGRTVSGYRKPVR
jgi:fido (protein-threonine AMPylation protein)